MTIPTESRLLNACRTYNRTGMLNSSTKRTLADRWYDTVLDLCRRANAGTVGYDGFTSGGYVEIRSTDDPERLTPLEAHMNRILEHTANQHDPVYELAERISHAYLEGAAQLKIVEDGLRLLDTYTTPTKGPGQTVGLCSTVGGHESLVEIPCGEQAVARGLCDGCRKRLDRYNQKLTTQGLEPVTALPKAEADAMFANRDKRRTHITGTLAGDAA